jgi:hypothetical protein
MRKSTRRGEMVGATHDGTSAKAGGSRILPFNGSGRTTGSLRRTESRLAGGATAFNTRNVQSYELPLDGIRLLISFRMLVARAMRLYLARKSAFAC